MYLVETVGLTEYKLTKQCPLGIFPFFELCLRQLRVLGGGNPTNVPSKIEVMVGALQPYLQLLFAQIYGGRLKLKCLQFLNSFRDVASDDFAIG